MCKVVVLQLSRNVTHAMKNPISILGMRLISCADDRTRTRFEVWRATFDTLRPSWSHVFVFVTAKAPARNETVKNTPHYLQPVLESECFSWLYDFQIDIRLHLQPVLSDMWNRHRGRFRSPLVTSRNELHDPWFSIIGLTLSQVAIFLYFNWVKYYLFQAHSVFNGLT